MLSQFSSVRHDYNDSSTVFDVSDLKSDNPFKQFEFWFEEARTHESIIEANAMAIATTGKDGQPSCRMVLMKNFDQRGFYFATNFQSRKGIDLSHNPLASLMFYWEPLKRSVRIEGCVEKMPEKESVAYFQSRPKESQIAAYVSHFQSEVVSDREKCKIKFLELERKYANVDVLPKPDYWGGYVLIPNVFEFWQGQTNRMHDRLRFRKLISGEKFNSSFMTKADQSWIIERLLP